MRRKRDKRIFKLQLDKRTILIDLLLIFISFFVYKSSALTYILIITTALIITLETLRQLFIKYNIIQVLIRRFVVFLLVINVALTIFRISAPIEFEKSIYSFINNKSYSIILDNKTINYREIQCIIYKVLKFNEFEVSSNTWFYDQFYISEKEMYEKLYYIKLVLKIQIDIKDHYYLVDIDLQGEKSKRPIKGTWKPIERGEVKKIKNKLCRNIELLAECKKILVIDFRTRHPWCKSFFQKNNIDYESRMFSLGFSKNDEDIFIIPLLRSPIQPLHISTYLKDVFCSKDYDFLNCDDCDSIQNFIGGSHGIK